MSRVNVSPEEEKEEEEDEEEEPSLDPAQLLNLAQTHLRLRNYTLTRQYSLELLSSSSAATRRATATQLLTISDILSSTDTTTVNHYSILQLDSFSSDPNLIRTHFKKLFFILDPIKHSSPLAHLALDFAVAAHDCLSDPVKKRGFDSELMNCLNSAAPTHNSNGNGNNNNGNGGFWTFCPYCFYVYEYDRVYEGCCLRCQNVACKRVFHGVALTTLPKMELDKGRYFSCFGYFPLGFEPGRKGDDRVGKFQNWCPIVPMFPANKTNDADFIEILDDSDDESDVAVKGNENMGVGVDNDRPRGMRRKSVARRKRKANAADASTSNGSGSKEGFFPEEGAEFVQGYGGGGGGERAVVGDLNEVDMAFFEGDGEVFVELGSDDAPLS